MPLRRITGAPQISEDANHGWHDQALQRILLCLRGGSTTGSAVPLQPRGGSGSVSGRKLHKFVSIMIALRSKLFRRLMRWSISGVLTFPYKSFRTLFIQLFKIATYAHVYTFTKLQGYRPFKPNPETIFVSCCTNGLGHVHQMERVLTVLQEAGLRFPVIALAKEQKVPAYKVASLKKQFPNATFINLNFEIDYDGGKSGKSFNNGKIVASATKTVFTRCSPFYRTVSRLLQKHRPAYCLSFWEPGVATVINVMNCRTQLVSVASQGQIYADTTGIEKGMFLRALRFFCVGRKGKLVPLSVRPLVSGIPQIVRIPDSAPPEEPPYFVAYSTVPEILSEIGTKMSGHRIRLFVKEHLLRHYRKKYKNNTLIEVRSTSPDFPDQLARSQGLIASPSRGVVTQAVALGKPVYLFCPSGHLEQEYNLRFYMQRFRGVSCPTSRRYRRYFGIRSFGGDNKANVTLPDGYHGRMQTLEEWESSLNDLDLSDQAGKLCKWLSQTDQLIKDRLVPLLTPT